MKLIKSKPKPIVKIAIQLLDCGKHVKGAGKYIMVHETTTLEVYKTVMAALKRKTEQYDWRGKHN